MSALRTLLAGFFDYAGLYPPARLDLRAAAGKYLEYAQCEHAWALGRFILNADRVGELRSVVGEEGLRRFRLSVIAPDAGAVDAISKELERGTPVETLEIKCCQPDEVERIAHRVPRSVKTYFEVALDGESATAVSAIANADGRAKIRMGGVVAEAFPLAKYVVRMLRLLARDRVSFKATAGLHHPIRSSQPLTYEPQSSRATMHGFSNLLCAAAVVYSDGDESVAEKILLEEDRAAWSVDEGALRWRDLSWSEGQIATLRREFFISVGSCSFEEPMRDLEALGWL